MGLLSTVCLLLRLSSCAAAASVVSAQQIPKIDPKWNDDVVSHRSPPIRKAISGNRQSAAKSTPWPVQLEMRVPFEPTAFPSGRHIYLMYELHLTNFGTAPLSLSRIEVLDAVGTAQRIVAFEGQQLEDMLQPLGSQPPDPKGKLLIGDGQTAIAFMSIAFERGAHIPDRLLHHVITANSVATGAVITTHHTTLHVLGPPVEGANWLAADGPSNDQDNHHRRGVFILDGRAVDSRRYAIDWKQIKGDASFSGDPRDVRSYYAYGSAVLAVAHGRVVSARDGLPDNTPGHGESFHPAVPITMDTLAGNMITLDIGGGQFAYYLHLQPGSVSVKAGDRVRRGQVLARIGSSGDAREPHLHFEVTTSLRLIAGEGVPYLIDRYRCMNTCGGPPELRRHELPLNRSVIEFGENHGKPPHLWRSATDPSISLPKKTSRNALFETGPILFCELEFEVVPMTQTPSAIECMAMNPPNSLFAIAPTRPH